MFCTGCGTGVDAVAKFCPNCGRAQQSPGSGSAFGSANAGATGSFQSDFRATPGNSAFAGSSQGPSPLLTQVFCYAPIVGWIAALYGLVSDRFRLDRLTRFHAFQGLYLFLCGLLAEAVLRPLLSPMPGYRVLHRLLDVALLAAGVYMMVSTGSGQVVRLPFLGDLAERSVNEQFPVR